MPRGSKPGERRGGRKLGTPNKKTVLKNAAIRAAAADPNVSPLDFFLNLMRDPSLELEVRITAAAAALPFAHARPREPRPEQPSRGKRARLSNFAKKSALWDAGARLQIKRIAPAPKPGANPDKTPLGFLLSVMRDLEPPPHLRFKVAAVVAPYFHPKRGQDRSAVYEIVIDDPFGFVVDPAVARGLRDDDWRLYELFQKHIAPSKHGGPLTAAEINEQSQLEEKVAATKKTLKCPTGYGELEAKRDRRRRTRFFYRRITPPPYNVLTEEEDAEDAHLIARIAAYEVSPEASGRARIYELEERKSPLTAEEQSELEGLSALYPAVEENPRDNPFWPMYERLRQANEADFAQHSTAAPRA
jgi:hypothetical protein